MSCRKRIPKFSKIRERVEKGETKREEVKVYRELASWKALSMPNPWEITMSGSHSGFSEEADAFLVLCVSEKERNKV